MFVDLPKAYDWPLSNVINEAYRETLKELYNGCLSAIKIRVKISKGLTLHTEA